MSQDTIREAVSLMKSKQAQRALLNTVLFVSTSIALLFVAVVASTLLYNGYVPDYAVARPIYLQYGTGLNPFGFATIGLNKLMPRQEYDVSVAVTLPLSPPNTEQGNFMIRLLVLDEKIETDPEAPLHTQDVAKSSVLFRSRRPAIIPYTDPLTSLASRVLFLGYHLMSPSSHAHTVTVPLGERIHFPHSSSQPKTAYLEVEAGQTIQIYHVILVFTAQLRGIRWLMYRHRLCSIVGLTIAFWFAEVMFTGAAWMGFSAIIGRDKVLPRAPEKNTAKAQEAGAGRSGGSDSPNLPMTFPSYGRQPPIKYEPEVKKEKEEDGRSQQLENVPSVADADDEGEEIDDGPPDVDSGIGSSYNTEGSASIRRRGSRP